MRLVVMLAAVALVPACGAGGEAADPACPALDADHPVSITTPFGDAALAEEWDAAEPGAEVELVPGATGPTQMAVVMLGDEPPTLTAFADWITPTVARLGVIETSTPCFDATRLSTSSWLLAYDRAAFVSAGLDPDAPPTTFDELHDAGVALRERAGFASPIAWPAPAVALFALDIPSDAARRAAQAWTRLGTEGLLYSPDAPPELPALGSGAAAIQVLRTEEVVLYAEAIAEGQAPGVDIGVARVPGLDGAISAIESYDWVVAAGSTPAQQVAASAFMDWLAEPEQQLRLHRDHALLPDAETTVETEGFRSYWSARPLIGAAWSVMHEGVAGEPAGVATLVGSWSAIASALDAIAFDDADFDAEWANLELFVERGRAAQANDAATFIRCISDRAPQALSDCV